MAGSNSIRRRGSWETYRLAMTILKMLAKSPLVFTRPWTSIGTVVGRAARSMDPSLCVEGVWRDGRAKMFVSNHLRASLNTDQSHDFIMANIRDEDSSLLFSSRRRESRARILR